MKSDDDVTESFATLTAEQSATYGRFLSRFTGKLTNEWRTRFLRVARMDPGERETFVRFAEACAANGLDAWIVWDVARPGMACRPEPAPEEPEAKPLEPFNEAARAVIRECYTATSRGQVRATNGVDAVLFVHLLLNVHALRARRVHSAWTHVTAAGYRANTIQQRFNRAAERGFFDQLAKRVDEMMLSKKESEAVASLCEWGMQQGVAVRSPKNAHHRRK